MQKYERKCQKICSVIFTDGFDTKLSQPEAYLETFHYISMFCQQF